MKFYMKLFTDLKNNEWITHKLAAYRHYRGMFTIFVFSFPLLILFILNRQELKKKKKPKTPNHIKNYYMTFAPQISDPTRMDEIDPESIKTYAHQSTIFKE